MTPPRVLLADDHGGILQSLKALLSEEFVVVGEVTHGDAVVTEAVRLRPDVVVLHFPTPGRSGLQSLPALPESLPSAAVVILTTHQSPIYSEEALRIGADAYVVKERASSDLISAIHMRWMPGGSAPRNNGESRSGLERWPMALKRLW